MGIPGLTRDMLQYLEPAVITRKEDNSDAVKIRSLVIDGPSMVHHVYDRVIRSNKTALSEPMTNSMPTYKQINESTNVFLKHLQTCGATIQRIFFDGALPLWKRGTRLDRLEKARLQLEHFKSQKKCPLSSGTSPLLSHDEISDALWQSSSGRQRSNCVIAPFIVPAVIEHLKNSEWSAKISIVPDEADGFCAAAAIETGAAVLTNDSDFLLLVKAYQDLPILLLNSLTSRSKLDNESRATINAQCWRPRDIMTTLSVESLRGIAFERARDSSASLAVIIQRSRLPNKGDQHSADEYIEFLSQLEPSPAFAMAIHSGGPLELDDLDPRLAELVCQLTQDHGRPEIIKEHEVWVTLPTLFEDPDRDASWAYGRNLRRLAYSLLVAAYRKSRSESPIKEFSRRGQRIAQEAYHVLAGANLDKELLKTSDVLKNLQRSASLPEDAASNYLLWALEYLLEQRATAGKQKVPLIVIRQYLGFADLPIWSPGPTRAGKDHTHDDMWNLVHLNSNHQAVLYSLRLLAQVCRHVMRDPAFAEGRRTVIQISQLLRSMPPAQDLILDTRGVRSLMQNIPSSRVEIAVSRMLTATGYDAPPRVDASSMSTARKKLSRKRKKQPVPPTTQKAADLGMSKSKARFSSNPFELLARES